MYLLGRNDGRQGIVTTDTDTHNNAPEDQHPDDGHAGGVGGQGLRQGREDNDHQLDAVHALSANAVSQPSKEQLADDGAARGCDLDGSISTGGELASASLGILPVDNAQHGDGKVNGEDVVRVSEKANASDDDSADMVPAELGLVDPGQGDAATFIRIDDRRQLTISGKGSLDIWVDGVGGHDGWLKRDQSDDEQVRRWVVKRKSEGWRRVAEEEEEERAEENQVRWEMTVTQ